MVKSRETPAFQKGLPIGIALGLGMGVAFSTALGNFAFIAIGLPIGIALAPAFGAEMLKRENAKRQIEEEKRESASE